VVPLSLCLSLSSEFRHRNKATNSFSMSLSLLPLYSSPHLSPSLSFPTPHLSFLCFPKLSNAPTPHFILCCRRNASFSTRCGPGVPEGAQHHSGIEEDDEQPMKASCDDDEEEEGQETLSSLVLPERWDVLGLGQAMVIPSSSSSSIHPSC